MLPGASISTSIVVFSFYHAGNLYTMHLIPMSNGVVVNMQRIVLPERLSCLNHGSAWRASDLLLPPVYPPKHRARSRE